MSQYSDYEQYDDSFSDSDNEILQSGEVKNRNMKAGYSSFADQEDLMESLSNALEYVPSTVCVPTNSDCTQF